jgi:hypothetical protein
VTSRLTVIAVIVASVASSAVTAALVGGPASGFASTGVHQAKANSTTPTSSPEFPKPTPGGSPTLGSLTALVVSLSKQVSNLDSSETAKLGKIESKINSATTVANNAVMGVTGVQDTLTRANVGGIFEGSDLFELLEELWQCSFESNCHR